MGGFDQFLASEPLKVGSMGLLVSEFPFRIGLSDYLFILPLFACFFLFSFNSSFI